jgi:hypothetical protein
MRQHREMIEERCRAEGLTAAEARTRAAREFGPLATAIEGSRAEWSFAWLEALWSDARYAARALRRAKTFSFTAVLTLGAGLALASVAFTLFNANCVRSVNDRTAKRGPLGRDRDHAPAQYGTSGRARTYLSTFWRRAGVVSGVERHWPGTLVSDSYFQMLGARMELGRGIARRHEW